MTPERMEELKRVAGLVERTRARHDEPTSEDRAMDAIGFWFAALSTHRSNGNE